MALLRARAPAYEFRTTVAPQLAEPDLRDIAALLRPDEPWFLQAYLETPQVDPAYAGQAYLAAGELERIAARAAGAGAEGGGEGRGVRTEGFSRRALQAPLLHGVRSQWVSKCDLKVVAERRLELLEVHHRRAQFYVANSVRIEQAYEQAAWLPEAIDLLPERTPSGCVYGQPG